MLVGSRGRAHQTLAPRLVVRLRSFPCAPGNDIVGMNNAPERKAVVLKLLAASSLVVAPFSLQVKTTGSLEGITLTA